MSEQNTPDTPPPKRRGRPPKAGKAPKPRANGEVVTTARLTDAREYTTTAQVQYEDGTLARIAKNSDEYKLLMAEKILAERMLARRRLIPFIQYFNPKYDVGWCHEVLAAKLEKFVEDCVAGRSPRLMITFPPRHGKSEQTSRKLPAFILGHYPHMEIILASYGISLAEQFSKHVIQLLKDERYQNLFPGTQLHPDDQAMSGWRTTAGGGFKPAGVGVGVTGMGAHCFPAGTPVLTSAGYVAIEDVVPGMSVYTRDVDTGMMGYRPIQAVDSHVTQHRLVEVVTSSGRRVRATPDHRFYVPAVGWVEAAQLRSGDELIVVGSGHPMHSVPSACTSYSGRHEEAHTTWDNHDVLLQEVPGSQRAEDLSYLPEDVPSHSVPERAVLLDAVHTGAETTGGQAVSSVSGLIQATQLPDTALLADLCQCSTCSAYAGQGEPALQGWPELRPVVPAHASAGHGTRQGLCGVPVDGASAYTPHQPRSCGQSCGEPYVAVSNAPHSSPQVGHDTVSVVGYVGEAGERVYDIQVEGTHCFFAGSVLVHNCLIIDDPFKDRQEADSDTVRNSTWDWYTDVAMTRLAPGGGILIINTRWHDDDLSGRLLAMMNDPEQDQTHIDQWDLVNFAAIAEDDEYLTLDHRLVTEPEEGAKLVRRAGDALHPARYPTSLLLRMKATMHPRSWNALYQQKPVPDDGEFFCRDQMLEYDPGYGRSDGTAYIACDFAISEKEAADWTVIAVGLHMPNDTVHVDDVVRFRSGDAFRIVDTLLTLFQKYKANNPILGVEDGQIWKSISALFFAEARRRGLYPSVELLKPLTDKQSRARPLQGRMQMHMVTFQKDAAWMTKVSEELLRFPTGVHDDIVDALSWMMQLVVTKAPPVPLTERRRRRSGEKTVQEQLLEHIRTGQNSAGYMSA